MPVYLVVGPTTTGPQGLVVQDASEKADGVMTASQVKKLNGLSPGGSSSAQAVQYTIKAGDGADFRVNLATAYADTNYVVTPINMSGPTTDQVTFIIPNAGKTTTDFRVITGAPLDVGSVLGFIAQHL